ncbi:hypothetical protein MMPV_004638 [Pyropia vietnamensis]
MRRPATATEIVVSDTDGGGGAPNGGAAVVGGDSDGKEGSAIISATYATDHTIAGVRSLPPTLLLPLSPSPRTSPSPSPDTRTSLTVYFDDRVIWERTYVQLLLEGPSVAVTYVPISTAQMQGKLGEQPVVEQHPNGGGATALVLNAMLSEEWTVSEKMAFSRLVRRLSPAVSVFCSDERGHAGWVHATLVAYSKTTLRPYGVYTYPDATVPGMESDGRGGRDGHRGTSHAIPLGYMVGMFDDHYDARRRAHPYTTTLASQRRYAWAFPAELTGKDREPMLAAFQSWAGAPYTAGPRNATAAGAAYEAAALVLNSHGNVVLDFFRLYEASMAGAIPVIVASAADFRANFGALPELPPWVVAPDWAAALAAVRTLAADSDALNARQRAVSEWWWRVNDKVHRLVEDSVVGRKPAGI